MVHRAASPCRAVRVRVLCCQEGQEDRFQGAQALSTQRKGRRTAVLAVASLMVVTTRVLEHCSCRVGWGLLADFRLVRLLLSVGGSVP